MRALAVDERVDVVGNAAFVLLIKNCLYCMRLLAFFRIKKLFLVEYV